MKPLSSFEKKFKNTASNTQDTTLHSITGLYNRYEDEPDFDCEFLVSDNMDIPENESILDPDTEEYADDYNDREWDTEIYDPYLEQTYF